MRGFLFFIGVLTLAAAWIGPLPNLARQAFFGHMLMHMLVVAVAAPLLALAIAGSRFDPVPRHPALYAPIPASVGELILVWGWHAPQLHHFARNEIGGLVAEQSTFLLAGMWVWLSAFGGNALRDGRRGAAGVVGLLLTSMHMTLLGALLALAPRPVYPHHSGFGSLTPLQDQHLGGAVMILIGGLVYLSGGLALTAGVLKSGHRTQEVTK